MPLTVALVPGPHQVVVRLTGDADLSTLPLVTDGLGTAARLGTRHVVVDVAAAHFWDCSALHALAGFTTELAAAGRSCRIVGALADTRRLIGIAYLTAELVLDGPILALPPQPAGPRTGMPARLPVSGHPVPPRGAPSPVGAGRTSRRA
jgi:anti-sigma B factor antagonist